MHTVNIGWQRWVTGGLGVALVATGLVAMVWLAQAPAGAQLGDVTTATATDEESADHHVMMHEMMDAMHGEGTAERVHEIEGVEEMMAQCAAMMDAMGGMAAMPGMMRGMERGPDGGAMMDDMPSPDGPGT